MFLSDGTLDISRFSEFLRKNTLDFSSVMTEVIDTNNSLIQPSHFFLALAKIEGGLLQKEFLRQKVTVQTAIEVIQEEIENKDGDIPLDICLKKCKFSPASLNMLDELTALTPELGEKPFDEIYLVFAVLKHLEPNVKEIFDDVINLDDMINYLDKRRCAKPSIIFDPVTGAIIEDSFDESGQIFLKLLKEKAVETGHVKINSTHIGIALCELEDGITQRGLRLQLKDPNEICRELKICISKAPLSAKKNISLNKASCYMSVIKILGKAAEFALDDKRPKIGESQLLRAIFTIDQEGMFVNILSQLKVNILQLQRYAQINLEIIVLAPQKEENPWEELKGRWSELETHLRENIIDQDEAIGVLLKKLAIAVFGVKEANKPIGVLFFAGPTGVGKTEIARVLAEFIFGSSEGMLRFNMQEYMESHALSGLIGSPSGYVGHENGGQLTNQVLEKPFSIVLFDEIEKAHKDIYNIFLQIFDDGKVTDRKGQEVNFTNTLIILTSNVGAKEAEVAGSKELDMEAFEWAFKEKFSPEIRNRLSNIVFFNPISKDACKKILNLFLNKLKADYIKNKNIHLKFSESIKADLLNQGFDREMGARPLRRVVRDNLNALISMEIAKGKIKNGDSVYIDMKKGETTFIVSSEDRMPS